MILYRISDWVVYPVVRFYRRKLVKRQLAAVHISSFYHHLADLILETLKMLWMSKAEVQRRVEFVGVGEALDRMEASGQRTKLVYLGHLGNWEWLSTAAMRLRHGFRFAQVYHPLHSPLFNKLMLHLRTRYGGECVTMRDTLRYILRNEQKGQRQVVGLIADQAPKRQAMHHFCTFLAHPDTPFITGVEQIAKRINAPVYYLDVSQPRRGYYRAELRLLTDEPRSYANYDLTTAYARLMEESIGRAPWLWLWTHNRWKRTREDALKGK